MPSRAWKVFTAVAALPLLASIYLWTPPSYFRIEPYFAPDPNYNPLPDIQGTEYLRLHADRFVASRSAAETQAIKKAVDRDVMAKAVRAPVLDQLLLLDAILIFAAGGFFTIGAFYRRRGQIADRSLGAAAATLRAARKVGRGSKSLWQKVKERADNGAK